MLCRGLNLGMYDSWVNTLILHPVIKNQSPIMKHQSYFFFCGVVSEREREWPR